MLTESVTKVTTALVMVAVIAGVVVMAIHGTITGADAKDLLLAIIVLLGGAGAVVAGGVVTTNATAVHLDHVRRMAQVDPGDPDPTVARQRRRAASE